MPRTSPPISSSASSIPSATSPNSNSKKPPDSNCASRCGPRSDILLRLLRHTPVDFDRTFEARAVFDHDLRRRQIPDNRAILLDLDPSLRAHVSFQVAVHHHVARVDVRRYLRRRSHRQLPFIQMNPSFDRPVDLPILGAGDFAFHLQARPEPPRLVLRCRIQWTHLICVLLTPHRNLLTVCLGDELGGFRREAACPESYSCVADASSRHARRSKTPLEVILPLATVPKPSSF